MDTSAITICQESAVDAEQLIDYSKQDLNPLPCTKLCYWMKLCLITSVMAISSSHFNLKNERG